MWYIRKGEFMKKAKSEELRPEYRREDLGPGVRGKYFESYQKGTNLVLLSPDVAKAFPTEEAVNDALRSLIELAQKSIGLTERAKKQHSV
ncbi:MAG: hypothetical protein NUV74_16685 [Candidatus Brocadiaceae bacterium]|nr:hypothetical protein [Candidatus Brocadiaceae bacterium]